MKDPQIFMGLYLHMLTMHNALYLHMHLVGLLTTIISDF